MRRRIFWDTMLLIYLLESDPAYSRRVRELLTSAYKENDQLLTSHLAVGEVLAGVYRDSREDASQMRKDLNAFGFEYLSFNENAEDVFARLRGARIQIADAIHLSCAASAGVDLFLTGDRKLLRLKVPGIHFIADFNTPLLW